jgi:hypothetical protein
MCSRNSAAGTHRGGRPAQGRSALGAVLMGATLPRVAVLAAWVGLSLTGCAGARVEAGIFYGGNYRVELPPGWRVVSDGRADLALARRDAPGGMLVNATCEGRERERSLPVLTKHLLFGLKGEQILARADVEVNGQPAQRTVFQGTSADAGPVAGEAYVIKVAGCVYDLLYVSPPEYFEQGRAAFDGFVRSLRRP